VRPTPLNPLFASVTALKGVGPRLGKLFEKLGAPLVVDLLWHLPTGLIDRRHQPKVIEAKDGEIATLTIVIDQHQKPHNPRQPYRVRCRDETGFLPSDLEENSSSEYSESPKSSEGGVGSRFRLSPEWCDELPPFLLLPMVE